MNNTSSEAALHVVDVLDRLKRDLYDARAMCTLLHEAGLLHQQRAIEAEARVDRAMTLMKSTARAFLLEGSRLHADVVFLTEAEALKRLDVRGNDDGSMITPLYKAEE